MITVNPLVQRAESAVSSTEIGTGPGVGEALHMATDYTPDEGRRLRGKPVSVLVHGTVVVRDGELLDPTPRGRRAVSRRRRWTSEPPRSSSTRAEHPADPTVPRTPGTVDTGRSIRALSPCTR